MKNMILTIAPTGNVITKAINENAAVTVEKIVEDICLCAKEGAAVAHIHARDINEMPTCDPLVYSRILDQVRERGCNIILQVSTGARGGENTIEGRSGMLDIRHAQMASLSIGSSNFAHSINANSPDLIKALAEKMYMNDLVPELECFDVSMAENIEYLRDKGIIRDKIIANMVMNVPGSIKGTIENLDFMLSKLPKDAIWNLSSIGKSHEILVPYGILKGGNIRTGLEDVPKFKGKNISNVELVRWVKMEAQKAGRNLATVEEAREILGIKR